MIKRKTTGSIVCPSCGRLISVNASECIHCGRKNPGLWGFGPYLQRWLGRAGVIQALIAACVIVYLISLLIDLSALLQPRGFLGLLAPSTRALDRMGMTGRYALIMGRWWTLVTAIYLHGGVVHILFNMLWLRQLGTMVEELFGRSRTWLIFTLSGISGFFFSDLFGIMFTVGASGSIFGLLGALIFYGRRRGGYFGSAIYRQVGTWAIVLFLFGFFMPAVNNIAHAGGFAGGYLAARILGFQEFRLESVRHRRLATATFLVTIVCFALAVVLH